MKVLLISVRSDIGGGPKHVWDLLSKADSFGIEYYIAAPVSGEYANYLKDLAKDNFEIPFRKFDIIYFIKLLSFLRKNEINIVHSHGRGAGLYSRLLKLFGYKVIHTFHGIHIGEGLVGKIKLLMDKLLIPLTDKFICVSESEKRSAMDQGVTKESKTQVIHNGVQFYGAKKKNNTDKTVIGTLARFNYQKGLDILISYFEKFSKSSRHHFEVHIAGDGEDFEKTKDLIEQKGLDKYIKLIGATNTPIDFLYSLDIYISFARFEGLPIAVLEAMSCGIPCLLSDVVGNKDIVSHEKNGLLFNLESYDDFEAHITRLIEKPEQREKFSIEGMQTIKSQFSIEQMCEQTFEIYKNV